MTNEEMLDKLVNQYGVKAGVVIRDSSGVTAKVFMLNEQGLFCKTTNLPTDQAEGVIPINMHMMDSSKAITQSLVMQKSNRQQ